MRTLKGESNFVQDVTSAKEEIAQPSLIFADVTFKFKKCINVVVRTDYFAKNTVNPTTSTLHITFGPYGRFKNDVF